MTDETIEFLDKALSYRRLIAYGGVMKKIHKDLNFKEDVSADVHIDEDGEIIDLPFVLKLYKWNVGFKNYVLFDKSNI